jgi:hypothetical protein
MSIKIIKKSVAIDQPNPSQVDVLKLVGLAANDEAPHEIKQPSVSETALLLLGIGIQCIPVGYKTKSPTIPGWPKLKIMTEEVQKHFGGQTNIGVLNGTPSNNLVDIDIDSPDCKPFLKWLQETAMVSGREGNPRSHYFFRTTDPCKTHQLKDDKGEMLIEVRSTGSQTIIPPSVHPEGGNYYWESFGPPGPASSVQLLEVASKIAAAAVISRYWNKGARHKLALALSGALLRHGWSVENAIDFIRTIAMAAGDTDVDDRIKCVTTTAEQLAIGNKVTGIPTLAAHLGKDASTLVTAWLKLHGTASEGAHETLVGFLNQTYAVVLFGGQTYVLREFIDYRERHDIELFKPGELRTLHANDRVITVDLLGRPKDVCVVDVWLKHPSRRLYMGIVFAPMGAPSQYYNLFKGFSVAPVAGDCSLYLAHLLANICQGNQAYFDYLLNWMAHTIQRPEELPGIAIVFRGQQGTGKGVATEEFGRLLEPHFIALTSMEQLVGRFTGHLKDRLLVYANEALWGGNKSAEGALKAMITDPNASVEQKFKDTVRIENFKRIMISSNEDWAVPVAKDDRRFFVLNVGNARKEDTAYFKAIIDQMNNGGSEALMHALVNRDLSNFDVRKPPQTPFNFDLKLLSMDTGDQFIYELLRKSSDEDWETTVQKRVMHTEYLDWCKDHGKTHKQTASTFGKNLKKLIPSVDLEKKETVGTGEGKTKRFPLYVFPELSVCRTEFELACKADGSIWSM